MRGLASPRIWRCSSFVLLFFRFLAFVTISLLPFPSILLPFISSLLLFIFIFHLLCFLYSLAHLRFSTFSIACKGERRWQSKAKFFLLSATPQPLEASPMNEAFPKGFGKRSVLFCYGLIIALETFALFAPLPSTVHLILLSVCIIFIGSLQAAFAQSTAEGVCIDLCLDSSSNSLLSSSVFSYTASQSRALDNQRCFVFSSTWLSCPP